jgi:hypothetical protein
MIAKLLFLAAGIVLGRKSKAIVGMVAPFAEKASAKFDEFYSESARKIGTTVEDLEDRAAEKRYRSSVDQH